MFLRLLFPHVASSWPSSGWNIYCMHSKGLVTCSWISCITTNKNMMTEGVLFSWFWYTTKPNKAIECTKLKAVCISRLSDNFEGFTDEQIKATYACHRNTMSNTHHCILYKFAIVLTTLPNLFLHKELQPLFYWNKNKNLLVYFIRVGCLPRSACFRSVSSTVVVI